MNIVRIKVKFLLSSMLTLGSVIKTLHYYSTLQYTQVTLWLNTWV